MDILPLDSAWVNKTLASLSLDQKIGQLLHGTIRIETTNPLEKQIEEMHGVVPGGLFLFHGDSERYRAIASSLQKQWDVPVVISSDLECGAGRMIEGATSFPDLMGLAAADSTELATIMGEATAKEGRNCGVHWCFGPVMDINVNPLNPIVNTRGLGDNPERISRLACAVITSMQAHGMVATAKHFPGDGFDARDQHLCTTINPLTQDQWRATSGKMFKDAIEAGVWTIMTGHISLPAFDPGAGNSIDDAPPATLSKVLTTDLLRRELGFQGVIITDAINMGGISSWASVGERSVQSLEAGADMVLFSNIYTDFCAIKEAVEQGRLSEKRIDESVRRVLALKEKLGLHIDGSQPDVSEAERARYSKASNDIARKAVTLVKDSANILPLSLKPSVKIAALHIRGDAHYNVDGFDALLKQTGADITRVTEQDLTPCDDSERFSEADVILVLSVFGPTWATGRIRLAGNYMRTLCTMLERYPHKLVFISFGSPYHLFELPRIRTFINAYSPDPMSQMAALELLTGTLKPSGVSPVNLQSPYNVLKQFPVVTAR